MKEQRITIEIDAEGRITADAEGFSDGTCLKDLEKLLEDLGSLTESIERKPDAKDQQRTTQKGLQNGRKP